MTGFAPYACGKCGCTECYQLRWQCMGTTKRHSFHSRLGKFWCPQCRDSRDTLIGTEHEKPLVGEHVSPEEQGA